MSRKKAEPKTYVILPRPGQKHEIYVFPASQSGQERCKEFCERLTEAERIYHIATFIFELEDEKGKK